MFLSNYKASLFPFSWFFPFVWVLAAFFVLAFCRGRKTNLGRKMFGRQELASDSTLGLLWWFMCLESSQKGRKASISFGDWGFMHLLRFENKKTFFCILLEVPGWELALGCFPCVFCWGDGLWSHGYIQIWISFFIKKTTQKKSQKSRTLTYTNTRKKRRLWWCPPRSPAGVSFSEAHFRGLGDHGHGSLSASRQRFRPVAGEMFSMCCLCLGFGVCWRRLLFFHVCSFSADWISSIWFVFLVLDMLWWVLL